MTLTTQIGPLSGKSVHHQVMRGAVQTSQRLFELDHVHLQSLEKRRPFEQTDRRVWNRSCRIDRMQYCQQEVINEY